MTEPYIGQINLVGFNFPPRGWALCNGALLPAQQNAALYALIGATYGGNGQNQFRLPNLCGRVPIGQGQGTGLASRAVGNAVGVETVTLTADQMPMHTHEVVARSTPGDRANAGGAALAASADALYAAAPASGATLAPSALSAHPGGLPHENMQPSLAMNFVIALEGVFPLFP